MELDSLEFSPEQQQRANAFVKAFSKKPVRPLIEQKPRAVEPEVKPPVVPVVKDPIPKPVHKTAIIDPAVEDELEPPSTPKVAIGAEYNALKVQENKEKMLYGARKANPFGAFVLFIVFVLAIGAAALSAYNFEMIRRIKQDQVRIISNQQVLFEKLARLGQPKRR